MLLSIEHRLVFEYDAFISESFMELRVEPRTDDHQTLRSFYLAVGPATRATRYGDWNGNTVHHFGITDFHDRIEILSRSVVETHPGHSSLPDEREAAPPARELGPLVEFAAFNGPVLRSPELERLAEDLGAAPEAPVGEQVRAMGALVANRFEYRKYVTSYRSTSDHILDEGGGVCQDFAHLALALLRLRGVPCRYVSGYLHMQASSDEPAQSHAWIEVATRSGAWIAFDPTHDQVPDERYVVVARGRHYDDVSPNRGIFRGGAREKLHAEVVTAEATRVDVSSLHREMGHIDVPVFHEMPVSGRRPASETPDPGDQQQQQQQ